MIAMPDRIGSQPNSIGGPSWSVERSTLWIVSALAPFAFVLISSLFVGGRSWAISLSGSVLILLLAVSSLTDLAWCKIPNWATYPAALWALVLNGLDYVTGVESVLGFPTGAVSLPYCIGGAAVGFILMLIMYRISGGGAGDVKLAAAIGALVGPLVTLSVLVNTYVVAGVVVICWLTWNVGPMHLIRTAWRFVGSRLFPVWVMPPSQHDTEFMNRPVPLAAFFAAGAVLALWQHAML